MIRRITLTPSSNVLSGKFRDGDMVLVFCDASNGAFTVSLPDARSLDDVSFYFVKIDSSANVVTVLASTFNAINSGTYEKLISQWDSFSIYSDKSNYVSDMAHGDVSVTVSPFASDESVETGDGVTPVLTVPPWLNGYSVTGVIASVYTKGVTGTTDIQISRRRAGSNADVLSTKVTIGDEFFAADGVVNTSNDDLATGDQLYVDVDAVHSGTAPLGLNVTITFGVV